MSKYKYGCIPSVKKLSHKQFSSTWFHSEADLPRRVDLRPWCSPVVDQGEQGSCTAQAIVGLREYMEIRGGSSFVPLSRAFLYYEERLMEGDPEEDGGAMISDGMEVLKTQGVCPEADMPYKPADYTTCPTDQAIADASRYKIDEYHSISSTALLKAALAEGLPVVIGLEVYESFESDAVARTGIVPVPDFAAEELLGGHAMLCVGYDLSMRTNGHHGYFIVRNSWGSAWGDAGYCYIPLAYFWHPGLVIDYWVGTKQTKGGELTMTLKEIERKVLELLVSLIQTDGPALAQQFLNDLVNLIESYIPNSKLSKLAKISWVDIRNALEAQVTQALLQAIVALITAYTNKIQ